MKILNSILILILFLGISACKDTSTYQVDQPEVNQPESGKSTVIGSVFSTTTDAPLSNVDIRLAEVVRVEDRPDVGNGLYVLDQAFSPGAVTDENGSFVVEDTEAKEYVIIIGDVERAYEVIVNESGKPKVWKAIPDQILNVGELRVGLSRADF